MFTFKIPSAPKLKTNVAHCVNGMIVNVKSEKKSSINSQNNVVQVHRLFCARLDQG